MPNRVVWFDIPATDLARAIGFYSSVLDVEVTEEFPGVAVMAHGDDSVGGCIFKSDDIKPSAQGPLLYLNVNGRLDDAITEVERRGGKIDTPKHSIGDFGQRAIVIDTEGNRIALHSE